MSNKLYVGKTIILAGKFMLGISLAVIIYSFYKYISVADIKVTFTFFEAKICDLFSSTYKVSYTNQQGMRVEKYASIFLSDPYVEYVLLKYKLALYNGAYLALFLILVTIIMICYFRLEIIAIIEEFKYQLLKANQKTSQANSDNLKAKPMFKNKENQSIEYQDL